jgi:predicted transcriptional regulator
LPLRAGETILWRLARRASRTDRLTHSNNLAGRIFMSQVVIVDNIRTGLAKAHRGTFTLTGETGLIDVFFTLTPEATPKIQHVSLTRRTP